MSASAEGSRGAGGSVSGTSRKVLLAVVVVLIAVVTWDVVIQMREPDPPAPEVQGRVAALFLFDAARALEKQRNAAGSLPADLTALDLPRANYEYVLADTGYSVTVRMADVSATYRSGDDMWRLLEQAGVR